MHRACEVGACLSSIVSAVSSEVALSVGVAPMCVGRTAAAARWMVGSWFRHEWLWSREGSIGVADVTYKQ